MIANAFGVGENGLQRIAIGAPPCGHCRQFMNELTNADTLRVAIPGESDSLLGSFLPQSFGPKELGIVGGLMSPQNHGLKIDVGLSELAEVAIEAANSSYAPYSKSPAGIAISFTDKTTISGSYLENAAFNPSLPALQMALAAKNPSDIREIAFADTVNSRIDHFSFARDFFKRKVPKVKIEYFQLNYGEKNE
jgi:cytidine deaminase